MFGIFFEWLKSMPCMYILFHIANQKILLTHLCMWLINGRVRSVGTVNTLQFSGYNTSFKS